MPARELGKQTMTSYANNGRGGLLVCLIQIRNPYTVLKLTTKLKTVIHVSSEDET